MDLATIDNVQELKAMAFDSITRLEIEQRNLQLIQARIAQLTAGPADKPDPKQKPKNDKADEA